MLVQLLAEVVQRGDAGVAAAGDVQRGKVEGQAKHVVAQGVRDELVQFRADLVGHAHGDGACGLFGCEGPAGAVVVGGRVQEGVKQRNADLGPGVGLPVHRVGQHGVPEPVGGVGELGLDGRVDARVRLGEDVEGVDARLDLAGEILEDDVLVFHLRHEARRLENAFTVPFARGQLPLVQVEVLVLQQFLHVSGEPVVFGVEHLVDCRQADVLVDAAVARDEVLVEHLVVVGSRGLAVLRRRSRRVRVGFQDRAGLAVVGIRVVGDVVKEGDADALDVCRRRHGIGEVAFNKRLVGCHVLGQAVGAAEEPAVLVGGEHRDVPDVRVRKLQPEHGCGLGLDVGPGCHAAGCALDQPAG